MNDLSKERILNMESLEMKALKYGCALTECQLQEQKIEQGGFLKLYH